MSDVSDGEMVLDLASLVVGLGAAVAIWCNDIGPHQASFWLVMAGFTINLLRRLVQWWRRPSRARSREAAQVVR